MSKKAKHSILPASSCERWWNCPGSVAAIKDIPNPPNKYTAGGTVAHSVAEKSLLEPDFRLDDLIGETRIQDGFEVEVTEEMIVAVEEYRDNIYEVWEKSGKPPIHTETRVELEEVNAVLFGTVDCHFIIPFQTLHVYDFKYGEGKKVSAWENKQLMEYALGLFLKEDVNKCVIHVCQPRVENGFSAYSITADQMREFQKELTEKAKAALDPKAKRVPGDWCKGSFCPARPTCYACRDLANEVCVRDFSTPAVIDVLTMEQIVKVLKYEDTVKDWMARVRDYAKELMVQGADIPGYKLIKSVGNAQWLDEDVVKAEFEDELGDNLFVKKLISPSQLEKIVGKKKLGKTFRDDYTIRPERGFKLVEDDKPGEPIKTIKAQEDFL